MTGQAGASIRFDPLDQPLGAEVHGLGWSRAQRSTGTVSALAEGLARHQVLVIRAPELSAADLVSLGRAFGELEILPEPDKRHPDHPEIFDLTNVGVSGDPVAFEDPRSVFLRGTERWHTDSSFREVPCLCTMLHAIEVPRSGGETEFADMVGAYEALDPELRAGLDEIRVVHSYEYSRADNPGRLDPMTDGERAKYPPVAHPLVRTHGDGRRSLYMGGHASHVVGMDEDEGRDLLARITEAATEDRFVYRHRWRPGDLVVWDNRTTLHRLRPYDIANERRVMRRVTVAGTEPVR